MFDSMMTNWKTSFGGLVLVGVALVETLMKVDVPGFDMGLGAALTAFIALLFAKDAAAK